jgi:adenylate/nucleoside-diphosphate kinase
MIDFTENVSDPVDGLVHRLTAHLNRNLAQISLNAAHSLEQVEDNEDSGYGDYGPYCPVSLVDHNLLRPGFGDSAARFEGRIYRFASPDFRTIFATNPAKYVTDRLPVAPPLRVIVIGYNSSGKSTQARKLARRLRCFHISYPERLREFALTSSTAHTEEIKLHLSDPKENALSPEAAVSAVAAFWNEEPYRSRGFILEGFPRNAAETKALLDSLFFADVVINLSISEETSEKRQLPKAIALFEKKRNEQIIQADIKAKLHAEAAAKRYDEVRSGFMLVD